MMMICLNSLFKDFGSSESMIHAGKNMNFYTKVGGEKMREREKEEGRKTESMSD